MVLDLAIPGPALASDAGGLTDSRPMNDQTSACTAGPATAKTLALAHQVPRAAKAGQSLSVSLPAERRLRVELCLTGKIPDGAAPGSYQLGLWMPDAAESLQRNPSYALRLANATWDATGGTNMLDATVTVEQRL